MHCEQKINENNNYNINYNIKEMEKIFHGNKNTFISDLCFFELEKFKCCKYRCSTNYMLFYEIDDFFKKKNEKAINIDIILNQENMKLECDQCKKESKTNVKFISFPKILIIVLLSKKEIDIKFYYNKNLDVGKYDSGKKILIIPIIIE